MRVIICGARDRTVSDAQIEQALTAAKFELTPTSGTLVCGMAPGVDTCAWEWARKNNITVNEHPAEWRIHGDRAGPIRNSEMVLAADACLAFPTKHSRGTIDCLTKAKRAGLLWYAVELE